MLLPKPCVRAVIPLLQYIEFTCLSSLSSVITQDLEHEVCRIKYEVGALFRISYPLEAVDLSLCFLEWLLSVGLYCWNEWSIWACMKRTGFLWVIVHDI
ncbi:unnamed protein product [Gordionus sp. m RMFG-2023]